ncbi:MULTISPECIES: glycosyltransferase family 39 protein [unclassified Bradyrhizobium]|uniref:glycosyltransferase family 39 protein n=1 Tax=unclassified Bradyrhizobium TaxID=2631580 RepID=UPI00247A7F99|nr:MULTISPECIES: glycosyltransferase family 39 protein [unclassified Bradyrhizobium]WGR69463.1 glycosyltransferase family 39 protein [Bradyrhizobium sp. ISRA426]WGR81518.1 glycosyltransferase family 39 protein [Bradyrhizobium sp. ISRA430]WGR84702.1 glycosyltransferase family 39 protein [Bradyrhizobium sp. ISRA432]
MRFTSLVIELIRARPRLVVWIVVLLQAAMWLFVALVFYRSPPGNLATLLAFGREYQVGTDLGPPLPIWLADIAYRTAGGHMFGVYVLAELCEIATFVALYHLARAVVGSQQAVLAVLLTMTVLAFSSPALDFGPLVLARPLWTLLLLHSWQIIGQRRGNAWFAWSIEAGLLLLTTPAAIFLLSLLAIFAVATAGGRRTLRALDPLFAIVVVAVLALPYAVWLMRAETLVLPPLPQVSELNARALNAAWLLGGLVLGAAAVPALAFLNTGWFAGKTEEPPIIYRPSVAPLAQSFVYFFALAPALGAVLIAGLFGLDGVVGGAGVVLVMAGLAVVVAAGDLIAMRRARMLRTVWAAAVVAPAAGVVLAVLAMPWTGTGEIATSMPARAISDFFDESFARRTNHRLRAVAGETQLASLIALHSGRPHLFIDADPARTPWMTSAKFSETGGVVVWRASDTAGTPPPDILKRFPGIVPEVPRAFEWLVTGRQQLLRVGWAIVRPKGT